MPAGDDLCAVQALNTNPLFYDYYGAHGPMGGDYNPAAAGERGWMWRTEAELADGADVVLLEDHTPLSAAHVIPGQLSASVHPGVGKPNGIVHFYPHGKHSGGDTYTLTLDIGGGDLTATADAVADDTGAILAGKLAANVVAGITFSANGADVLAEIDAVDTAFTKFEIAVAATP